MATKKGSSKKTAKKSAATKDNTNGKPMEVEPGDLLVLRVASTSRENADLKLQLAEFNLEKLKQESEQAASQFAQLQQQANEKYELTPGKDTVNINTGEIVRG